MSIPERFLSLGDSFTIGTGTTPDRSFPAVLARTWTQRGRTVVLSNPAVNGYTTDDLIRDALSKDNRARKEAKKRRGEPDDAPEGAEDGAEDEIEQEL